MPMMDDDEDEDEMIPSKRNNVSGGTVAEEYAALADEHEEPKFNASALNDPNFPAGTLYKAAGGKLALPAWSRLMWFRNSCPDWTIKTEPYLINDMTAIFRAEIFDELGRSRATATKSWSSVKSGSGKFYIECAETGAVARALEMLGFSPERCKAEEGRNYLKQNKTVQSSTSFEE